MGTNCALWTIISVGFEGLSQRRGPQPTERDSANSAKLNPTPTSTSLQ